MEPVYEPLAHHLRSFRSAPFLFVGAGLPRRYLDLDDWEGLLRRLASLTEESYDFYFASANGDYATIATLIAKDLHPIWWKDLRFAKQRELFKDQLKTDESALKAEASAYLAGSIDRLPTSGPLADEIAALKGVVVDGVITTNFDPLLETLFPEFEVFVGQERLLFNEAQGVGEIYKIHGSHGTPDSLVLTAADYRRFHQRNQYLAAKLMTIFVEHPIVFLGYSLSDPNVATILKSIVECLDSQEGIAKLADRLVFIQWDAESEVSDLTSTVVRVDDAPIPVKTMTVPDFLGVFTALGSLQRGFPAKLLRRLKEQVYELVLEDQPKGRLHVMELDDRTDLSAVEVVFGVGAISKVRAYTGLGRDDLLDDLLGRSSDLNPTRVVQEALPSILSHPGNVPIYKYLRGAGLLDQDGALLEETAVDKKIVKLVRKRDARLGLTTSYAKAAEKAAGRTGSLDKLVAAEEAHNVLQFIPALDPDSIDPEELRGFLIGNKGFARHEFHRSQWVKMACLYDWLAYGPKARGKKRRPAKARKASTKRAKRGS